MASRSADESRESYGDRGGRAGAACRRTGSARTRADACVDKFRDRPGFEGNYLIRLAAAVGDVDLAIRLARTSQYYGNYRWLVADPDMATLRNNPAFRELLNELYAKWQRDVAEVGPSLPARPPKLPTPQAYLMRRPN